MRKRFLAATAAAAALAAPATAFAEPSETDPPDPGAIPGSAAATAVLPTGEEVVTAPDGTITVGDGTIGFTVSTNAEGDRTVIPLDAVDDIAEGDFDAADFNIDSPGSEEPTATAAEEGTPVTVTGRWLDGTTPDAVGAEWVDLETGERAHASPTAGGSLELTLEPGRYHLLTVLFKDNGQGTSGIISFEEIRVRDKATEITVNGRRAQPVGFEVDRDDAEQVGSDLEFWSSEPGAEPEFWQGFSAGYGNELYAIPSGRLSDSRDTAFVLRAGYASPEGTAEPYSYSLFETWDDGLPRDLTPEVDDEDLARIDAEYQSLGTETDLHRMDLSQHPLYDAAFWTSTGPVHLPSERTEFYTADEDVTWSHRGYFEYGGGIGSPYDEVYQSSGVLEPGSQTAAVWNGAPVSVGLDRAGADTMWPMVYQWDERDGLWTSPWMNSSASDHQAIHSEYHPGKITLAQDGEILGQNSEIGLGTPLSLIEPGPLTLTVDTARDVPWTPLGTAASARWDFDFDPEAANPIVPVSVVDFTVSGVENGYAEAGTVQRFDLEFATQPGADDQECASMTFEVSFDDGATWEPVAIDREGDFASAELELPDEPGFVSVRFTAADEEGNTVEHSTIRSYGIR